MPNSVSSCIQMVHAHWFLCVCGLNLLRIERNIFWMASQLGLEEYLRNQQKNGSISISHSLNIFNIFLHRVGLGNN